MILRNKEIVNMSPADMQEKLKDLRLELMKTNTQKAARQNIGKAKEIRKTIARILTALSKKQKTKQ